ncbi:hypothetical protein BH688_03715 [Kushneria phosphatilytica]|nr:hypothetical protein BH688_03715 [Kushneria phosphatilytica]
MDSARRRLAKLRLTTALALAAVIIPAHADDPVLDATQTHQQRQQALQQKIDNADDATRQLLREWQDARESAERIEQYNQTVGPMLDQQQQRIEQQQQALASMDKTREALPATLHQMVDRLREMVQADIPFHRAERLARLDALDRMLEQASMAQADKLKRVLSTWQQELDYGTDIEAWRGSLFKHPDTEVQYLRLGRVGWYYLSLDGNQGGVWQAKSGQWQPLKGNALEEIRRGIRIANDQRSPELLSLPLSVELSDADSETNGNDSNTSSHDSTQGSDS